MARTNQRYEREQLIAMRNLTLGALIVAVTAFSISLDAQRATRPRPATPPPAPTGPASVQKAAATGIEMTATSANVAESGTSVRIQLFRWSNDEERTPLLAALNPPARRGGPPPAAAADGARGGAPDGARAGAAPPQGGDAAAAGARGGRAAGAAAAAGRGGRGGRGAPPPTPIEALTAAIGRAPTLGYIWTTDVTGYSIKYAWHATSPEGERIVLVTDRRFGAYSPEWKLKSAEMPTDYEFTVIELRLDPKGVGEGKASLTTKVAVDNAASTVALENYAAAPVIFQNVKQRRSGT
jgi:hypothetical protein